MAVNLPDTLIITALGFIPDTLPVSVDSPLTVRLREAPQLLSEMLTSTSRDAEVVAGQGGSWRVSGSATKALPTAGEPDINRALTLIPGVSFSSMMSARPMLRGFDADDAGYTLDGFEAINLYHIGRLFAAVPAIAVDHATVDLQPVSAAVGRTGSGRITIHGRTGSAENGGELQYGLGAFSGAVGWGGKVPTFIAGRTARGTLVNLATALDKVPFGLEDLYLHSTPRLSGRATLDFTAFYSADHLSEQKSDQKDPFPDQASTGLRWHNLVVGAAARSVGWGAWTFTPKLSYAEHVEDATAIPVLYRDGEVDVRNRFNRTALDLDARWEPQAGGRSLLLGASVADRTVDNGIRSVSGSPVPQITRTLRYAEWSGFGEAVLPVGSSRLSIGLRLDGEGDQHALQPRLQFRRPLAHDGWLSIAAGRSSRLHHLVSDERSEPKLAYYDIWLPAGDPGIPVARTDHIAAEVGGSLGRWKARTGIFYSFGHGLVDLTPPSSDGTPTTFRSGRARVSGIDGDLSLQGNPRLALFLSYAYTRSARSWGEGWTNWLNERRHQLRATTVYAPGLGLRLALTAELSSGTPYTPFTGYTTDSSSGFPRYRPIRGAENAAHAPGALRADGSITRLFRGPLGLSMEAGLSVTNFTFGNQVPYEARLVGGQFAGTPRISAEPIFDPPAIPSLIFRGKWTPKR